MSKYISDDKNISAQEARELADVYRAYALANVDNRQIEKAQVYATLTLAMETRYNTKMLDMLDDRLMGIEGNTR